MGHPSKQTKLALRKGADAVTPYRDLSYDDVVGNFIAARPSPALAVILRDNPARLYGF